MRWGRTRRRKEELEMEEEEGEGEGGEEKEGIKGEQFKKAKTKNDDKRFLF